MSKRVTINTGDERYTLTDSLLTSVNVTSEGEWLRVTQRDLDGGEEEWWVSPGGPLVKTKKDGCGCYLYLLFLAGAMVAAIMGEYGGLLG